MVDEVKDRLIHGVGMGISLGVSVAGRNGVFVGGSGVKVKVRVGVKVGEEVEVGSGVFDGVNVGVSVGVEV